MEVMGSKTVVHNYGHGGSGITLSWGCAGEVLDIVTSIIMSKLKYHTMKK